MAALVTGNAEAAEPDHGRAELRIQDPNILQAAVHQLGESEGWIVDYEAFLPFEVGHGGGRSGPELVLDYAESEAPEDVLRRLLDVSGASGLGFEFRVLRNGQRVRVVPARMQDEQGAWRTVEPLLDTLVTLPPGQAPATDLVHEIVKQVDVQRDEEFIAGVLYPRGWQVAVPGFDNVPARQALEWVLDRVPPNGRMAWRVQPWDTGLRRVHVLSVVAVCTEGMNLCRPDQDTHSIWVTPANRLFSE